MPDEGRNLKVDALLQTVPFSRVLIINQKQAEIDRFGKLLPNGGFCYGYGEYWKSNLLLADPEFIKENFPIELPLIDEVIRLQRSEGCSVTFGKLKRHPYSATMINFLVEKYLLSNRMANTMIPICMIESPRAPSFHDVRAFWDSEGYLHWFDANAGWFKSNTSNPSHESIANLIIGLFKIIDYHFRCCIKLRLETIGPQLPRIPSRLTPIFDKKPVASAKPKDIRKQLITATSLAVTTVDETPENSSSSDEESETEQLRRWLNRTQRSRLHS